MASNAIITTIAARKRITARDVKTMRKAYFSDVAITAGEADELIALNDACPKQAPSWKAFFAEALAGVILEQTDTAGRISQTNARWLATRIDANGKPGAAERAVLGLIERGTPSVSAMG